MSVAVPSPLSVKVTPSGRAPASVSDGVGAPVAATLNDPSVPTVNVTLFPLVMAGADVMAFTVNVNVCCALGETPLLAIKVMLNGLPTAEEGVPLSVAVPSPLSLKFTPAGRVPVAASNGTGRPVVVTLKDPNVPTTNVVLFALVMASA